MRFITLCAKADTGNIDEMLDEYFDKVGELTEQQKPLTLSDWYATKKMLQFATRYNERFTNPQGMSLTPLLELPFKFAAIEKDLPNFMQWHIRSQDHATLCTKKILKTVEEEIENREELLSYYNE